MSKLSYDDVYRIWKSEVKFDELGDLEDLRLGDMISYLSKTRLSLAHTDADNQLQANLFTQEIQNLEFMIRDLLQIRSRKIVDAALAGKRPVGLMTISEEELYNRVLRGMEAHSKFIEESLAGSVSSDRASKTRPTDDIVEKPPESEGEIEYITLKFLTDVPASVGIDGTTLGPFKAEDIASVPAPNAKNMIHNHVAVRVVSQK
ncbi:MAG: hypothetical protein GF411_05290 [Candidatus Lokiarchaeota archaeon]|nr:hypothetical protein [Candidatus Lokiarchaeota archaeon]